MRRGGTIADAAAHRPRQLLRASDLNLTTENLAAAYKHKQLLAVERD